MEISVADVDSLIQRGNLAQADLLCLSALKENAGDAMPWLERRLQIANALGLRFPNDPERPRGGYLVIRSWGSGFWADVEHVIAQLLLAEITGREPIVHWGANCLYGGTVTDDAFSRYFEPVGNKSIAALSAETEFFPPKWNAKNLTGLGVSKMGGRWSRMSAIYFLNRRERVLVADFGTQLNQLMTWIPDGHPLFGLTNYELTRALISRYLRPRSDIVRAADDFVTRYFGREEFIALHLRGTNKATTVVNLSEGHGWVLDQVDSLLQERPKLKIFLMTDDLDCLALVRARHAERVVMTDAERTSGLAGTHFNSDVERGRRLGAEVMTDVYIALQARYFVGMGASHVSSFIVAMGDWQEGAVRLVGESQLYRRNLWLNEW